MIDETPFTTGGPVHIDDEKIYISREADQQLLKYCLEGEYSVVLTSRQMGKTSLLYHTIRKLKQYDIATVYIDLNKIGTGGVSADDWFKSILEIIREDLNLDIDIESFWNNYNNLAHGLRFSKFMRDVALKGTNKQLIIFIDEIELTTQLEYSDSFFSVIRSLYTERSANSEIKRLSFVLVGMARISDLIKQPDITTFNVGKRIDLNNFAQTEIAPLIKIIPHQIEKNESISSWVLTWTGGQPFLTQLLCEHLSLSAVQIENEEQIEIAALELIKQPDLQDKHTNTIQRYLISKPSVNIILGLYALVLVGKSIPDFDSIQAVQYIKLSGVFVVRDGYLRIGNHIYSQVFNLEWVEKQLKSIHTSLDVAINIAQNSVRSVSENLDLKIQLPQNEEADRKLDEIVKEAETVDNGRIFLTAAGILGGIILISIAALTGVYLFARSVSSTSIVPAPVETPNPQVLTINPVLGPIILIAGVSLLVMLIVGIVVSANSKTNKGSALPNSNENRNIAEALEFWNKKYRKMNLWDGIAIRLKQADLKIKFVEIIFLLIINSLSFGYLTYLLNGSRPIVLIVGGALGLSIPFIYINLLREKRLADFTQMLPEGMYLLINGIRSGSSLFQAMESVTRNISGIIRDEFDRVTWEVQINVEQSLAFAHMLERNPSADLSAIVGLLNLHREVGVRLVDVFDIIRFKVSEKVKATFSRFGLLQFYLFLFIEYFLAFVGLSEYTFAALSTSTGNLLFILNLIGMSCIAVLLNRNENENKLLLTVVFGGLLFLLPLSEISKLHIALIVFMGLNSNMIYWLLTELIFSKDTIIFSGILSIPWTFFLVIFLQINSSLVLVNNTSGALGFSVGGVIVGVLIFGTAIGLLILGSRFSEGGNDDNEKAYREYYRGKSHTLAEFELFQPFFERIIIPSIQKIGELSTKFTPHYIYISTEKKLEEGGNPGGGIDASTFLAARFAGAGVFGGGALLLLLISGIHESLTTNDILSGIIFISLIGFMAPNAWLDNIIRMRKVNIEYELPYAVNLLWACSDVGLSLSGSIKAVFEAWDSNLAMEFGRVTREIQLGKGIREALNDMAIRVNIPKLTSLVGVLVQGDYLGIPLSTTLKTYYAQMMANHKTDNNLDQVIIFTLIGLSVVLWIAILVLGQAVLIK